MKTVRHFGIVVSSLEQSLPFYRDLLGLNVVRSMDEHGPHMDKMLALENVRVTTVKMSADSGSTLVELLEYKSHPRKALGGREICSLGPTHVAFTVDDLEATYSALLDSGVDFLSPPQRSPDGAAKVVFCKDPDGTPLELVEVLR